MALTNAQKTLLEAAKRSAIELGERGKNLTSLIGELSVCQRTNLTWEPSDGYDARLKELTFQIKTRKSWSTSEVNPSGRLGHYGTKKGYLFDVAIYIELDNKFDVASIWHMDANAVRSLEEQMGKGTGLHVSTFTNNAEKMEI
jgi:hypothetical protein